MTDRLKTDGKYALETGHRNPCFPAFNSDPKRGNEIKRKECNEVDKHSDCKDSSKKRKHQCFLSSLNWIRSLAKDPLNMATTPFPEMNKWRYYDGELPWKQILSARGLLQTKVVAPQPCVLQKRQKMHPSMYDDIKSGNERVRIRCSRRFLAAKDSSHKRQSHSPESSSSGRHDEEFCDEKQADDDVDFWFLNHRRKRPRIGPLFQADLQACGQKYAAASKWFGTRIWPLGKVGKTRVFFQRDPIGKGRAEPCGCQFPGHPDCVIVHIREKRIKAMLELRSAFYAWRLNFMGEQVALSWTTEDQKKFQITVETNRLSSDKFFWNELFKCFPGKGREALVSYYFNVFLLRRRSEQNRSSTSDIYSDDEESEVGPIANRFGGSAAADSIFLFSKKTLIPDDGEAQES